MGATCHHRLPQIVDLVATDDTLAMIELRLTPHIAGVAIALWERSISQRFHILPPHLPLYSQSTTLTLLLHGVKCYSCWPRSAWLFAKWHPRERETNDLHRTPHVYRATNWNATNSDFGLLGRFHAMKLERDVFPLVVPTCRATSLHTRRGDVIQSTPAACSSNRVARGSHNGILACCLCRCSALLRAAVCCLQGFLTKMPVVNWRRFCKRHECADVQGAARQVRHKLGTVKVLAQMEDCILPQWSSGHGGLLNVPVDSNQSGLVFAWQRGEQLLPML